MFFRRMRAYYASILVASSGSTAPGRAVSQVSRFEGCGVLKCSVRCRRAVRSDSPVEIKDMVTCHAGSLLALSQGDILHLNSIALSRHVANSCHESTLAWRCSPRPETSVVVIGEAAASDRLQLTPEQSAHRACPPAAAPQSGRGQRGG